MSKDNNDIKIDKRNLEKSKTIHRNFKIGIMLKSIEGVINSTFGALIAYLNPMRLSRLISFITNSRLSRFLHGNFINYLSNIENSFNASMQIFLTLYLSLLGASKIILAVLLRQGKIWAYPFAIFYLSVFVVIQLNRYYYTRSILLIFLTMLDIIMIVMMFIQYKKVKSINEHNKITS